MVVYSDVDATLGDDEVDRIFRALADATRRDIVQRTLFEDASISDLGERYEMSFAAVQKHITVLEGAGLVTKHRSGRMRRVRANAQPLRKAQRLLQAYERIWQQRVAQLDALLAEE